MAPWAPAFAIAVAVTLTATPLLRRLAISVGFVDERCVGHSHRRPVPYLGGVGLILGVLLGLLVQRGLSPRVGVIALGAAVLGTVGLIDDDRHVHPRYRLLAEVAVAAATVGVGLRIHATGATVPDIALTMLWIVGVTNAVNLLDNMDGLAAGVVASASAAVFALAILGEQVVVAAVAAAVAGACLAFLPHNRRPARIFMGDAGSLFLGFVISILTIDVSPAMSPPVSFAVPLMLLALPILDTTMVTVARLRRHRSVVLGGKDHLSHRLVVRGYSRRKAVKLLVGVQTLLGGLALLAGREVVPLGWAAIGAVVVISALAALTVRAAVYPDPVLGISRRLKLFVLAPLVAIPIVAAPAVLAMVGAIDPAREGAASARRAFDALGAGDTQETAALFQAAQRSFDEAHDSLEGPLVSLGLVVPGVASNVDASRTVVSIGRRLSSAGAALSRASDPESLRVRGGAVPLDALRTLAPALDDASRLIDRSADQIKDKNRFFLVAPLRRAVDDLQTRLERESKPALLAAKSARLVPGILGADGVRRYFLAFQNNAEMRGSGGLIGNWGELEAEGGRLRLERFGRLEELNDTNMNGRTLHMPPEFNARWGKFNPGQYWQQVNVSPDFPTTGRVISDLYPQSGGRTVDGVIAVDPPGLAALLRLTGPVTVPNWSEPITADNVVGVTLKDAYARFPSRDDRAEFLGDVARRVTEAFAAADLGSPATITNALSDAARAGHLQMYLGRNDEQSLAADLGIDGSIPPPLGDSLAIVNQNMAANKVDVYLTRKIEYDVLLDPDREPAQLSAKVRVTMQNGASSSGLPQEVIGPYTEGFAAGENRTYVSVYSPLRARSATVDGEPVQLEPGFEVGHEVSSAVVSIPAREQRTLQVDLDGKVELAPGGWYRLDVAHQPSVEADDLRLSLRVAGGWRIVDADGLSVGDGRRHAVSASASERRKTVWVKLERTGWDRVRDNLWRSE